MESETRTEMQRGIADEFPMMILGFRAGWMEQHGYRPEVCYHIEGFQVTIEYDFDPAHGDRSPLTDVEKRIVEYGQRVMDAIPE